jgi:hypothetical protein
MTRRHLPRADDIVIRATAKGHTLARGGGPPQLLAGTLEAALRMATTFAQQSGCRVWTTSDGTVFDEVGVSTRPASGGHRRGSSRRPVAPD